jgi:hypothetical protein
VFVVVGGLIQERAAPDWDSWVSFYGKIVHVVREFDLHGSLREPINREGREIVVPVNKQTSIDVKVWL